MSSEKGFTLIELLIVTAITLILAMIAIGAFEDADSAANGTHLSSEAESEHEDFK